MKYTKPEVAVLGQAIRALEQLNPAKISGSTEPPLTENPGYDLDE
jgi:hypothetical protein